MENRNDSIEVKACPAPICSAIFVIVHVSYDYFRFQDNLGAAADFETAKAIAERESVERGSRGDALPIIEIADESFAMDSPETRHIWIEVFSQNTKIEDA
jgi:hypothetical protein